MFPKCGFHGLTIRDYLSELLVYSFVLSFILLQLITATDLFMLQFIQASEPSFRRLIQSVHCRLIGHLNMYISLCLSNITKDNQLAVCVLFIGLRYRKYVRFQVLHQDETPLLYSLVFGEGVVNDATSIVLFNSVQKINVDNFTAQAAGTIILDFLYLFFTSTCLGVAVSLLFLLLFLYL